MKTQISIRVDPTIVERAERLTVKVRRLRSQVLELALDYGLKQLEDATKRKGQTRRRA
jgi:predicted transcriptional regulator